MKIGISTCGGKEINDKFLEACRETGIDCLEIALHRDLYADYNYKNARMLADKYGVELWSFHLPFSPFATNDISSTNEETRSGSVKYQKSLMRKAGEIGIKHFIIHPSAEPVDIGDRRDRLLCSKQSLSELADEAEKFGAVMCVEDLPRTCIGRSSYDLCELTKDDERLRICFDTNHLLGEYIPDFVRKVGKKIETLHVSDYDFWNERHWLPGEGSIDWAELYNLLIEVGYKGPWLYEVSFGAPSSIVRDRDLKLEDFVRNAKEIMNGEKLTVLGKPIDDMPFRF